MVDPRDVRELFLLRGATSSDAAIDMLEQILKAVWRRARGTLGSAILRAVFTHQVAKHAVTHPWLASVHVDATGVTIERAEIVAVEPRIAIAASASLIAGVVGVLGGWTAGVLVVPLREQIVSLARAPSTRRRVVERPEHAARRASLVTMTSHATTTVRYVDELCEMSDLLASSEDPSDVFSAIFARIQRVVRWRTVVVVDATGPSLGTHAWSAEDVEPKHASRARRDAMRSYELLVDVRSARSRRRNARPTRPTTRRYLFFPLTSVRPARGVFGALQIEPVHLVDEEAVTFVNGAANQLAIALERKLSFDLEERARAIAIEADRRLEVLADVDAALSSESELASRLDRAMDVLSRSLCSYAAVVRPLQPIRARAAVGLRGASLPALTLAASRLAKHVEPVGRVVATTVPGFSAFRDLAADASSRSTLSTRARHAAVARLDIAGGLGALVLFGPSPFDAQDIALLAEIAARLGAAIREDVSRAGHEAHRRRVDDALGAVAHDLRGPLEVIALATSLLARPSGDASLLRIGRACNRMRSLVDGLLDSARADDGSLCVDVASHDVRELVEDAADAVRDIAAKRSIRLVVECPGEVGTFAVDKSRIERVLANLLGNALKFTPRGGAITLRAAPAGDHVILSVADTGAGIAGDDLPHVFERFWQGDRGPLHGAGLGLYIVRQIVEAHGGSVSAESEPGKGATFHVRLPRGTAPARRRSRTT